LRISAMVIAPGSFMLTSFSARHDMGVEHHHARGT